MLKQELTVNFKKEIFIGTQTCNQDICETEMLGLDDSLSKKMGDSKLWQGLPGLYEAHLGLDEAHLRHILMGFQNTGGYLRMMHE